MSKRKQIGFMSLALALGSLAVPVNQVNAYVPVSQNVRTGENKEAIPKQKQAVKPVSEKNRFGGWSGQQNPFKHIVTPKKNQRQIRKWKRQNQNAF